MTITRKQFRLAIREGILAAPALPSDACAALHRVGREATSFGNNFDSGCPMALAVSGRHAELPQGTWQFVTEFDRQMANIDTSGYLRAERVLVSDD